MKINLSQRNSSPTSDRGITVKYAAAQRGGYHWQRYLIIAIVVLPFLFLCFRAFKYLLV